MCYYILESLHKRLMVDEDTVLFVAGRIDMFHLLSRMDEFVWMNLPHINIAADFVARLESTLVPIMLFVSYIGGQFEQWHALTSVSAVAWSTHRRQTEQRP